MFGIKRFKDDAVIEGIRNGEEDFLIYLYKEYYSLMRNFVMKHNGNEDEAEDIIQDVVIAAWQNIQKPDFILQVKLSTYLLSITKNQWFKQLRKKQRFTVIESQHEKKAADDIKVDAMDINIVKDFVAALDDTCRKLLTYFYFDGYKNEVIAQKLGFANANTVKSKKYQCFKKLQTEVTNNFEQKDFFEG